MAAEETVAHAEPVAVGAFATTGEAEVAQALLAGYGIESMVIDSVEGGVIPIEGEPGVELLVRAADGPEATAILSAVPDLTDEPGAPGDTGVDPSA